ncbi:uncharacterized protein TM35_000033480 [Trypanosoma theileri]|uniref:Protein ZIP4 homolog n=1 Tax=Trypanosoma theileri TaxID=67003 RepID=A0A1X0P6X9_9TRYP|nr:uncharacterized protein TM35_000033480 [Trypanosoma theileri]ORC92595.1 hypothetical protein TM35_000033480 [Trypanosoma theileri]
MDMQLLSSKLDEVLHRFATRNEKSDNTDAAAAAATTSGGDGSDSDALFSDVTFLIQCVEEMTTSVKETGNSPPVKTLEELRVLGSVCWNMTVRHSSREDGVEEQKLRASLRDFATRAFLLGNYAYSGKNVCHSYFTQHPREAEQCVVMCLKTSRDLSLCGIINNAKELLSVGEVIASYISAGVKNSLTHLKHRNISWEFAYTNMDILWNVGNYRESCQAAEKLTQMLLKDSSLQREHRETFFRFVFTIGNGSVPLSEESYIRTMLNYSIEVQNHFKLTGTKDPEHHLIMLRGSTLEQMALSCLREGNAKDAVPWAESADTLLHSTTSSLLRLKVTAESGMEREAILLLHEYVQRSDVSVDEAVAACFELHKLLKNARDGIIEGMQLLYFKVKDSTLGEYVAFRFIQLLLHDGSLVSCKRALEILKNEGINFEDTKSRRYCFIWLWELSENTDFTRSEILQCLETALRFKECASESEINILQLRLCAEYISHYEESHYTNALTNAKDILLKLTEKKLQCIFTHSLLFKIAVLESQETEVENELKSLMKCEPVEMVGSALCSAINYSLKCNYLHGVSLAASYALFSSSTFLDAPSELEVLRVYVASLLSNTCTCSDEQLRVLVERFRSLISDQSATISLTHDEVIWWAQAFLLVGSEFTDGPGHTSVSAFSAATLTVMCDPNPGNELSKSLLCASILCTLDDEFQLFITGRPCMELCDLNDRLQLCKKNFSTLSSRESRIILLLSEAESHLREPSSETTDKIDTIIKELTLVPAAFEDYEGLADGASFIASQFTTEHAFLHGIVMKLYMQAVRVVINTGSLFMVLSGDKDEESANCITDTLLCLYKSFLLAFDRTEQMVVVQQLIELLSLTIEEVTITAFIKRCHADSMWSVITNSMSYMVLFLEYFAVESWNNSVFYMHLADTTKQKEWAQIAWVLVNVLPETNNVASALLALKSIIPL